MSTPGGMTLVQCGEYADQAMHAGASVAHVRAWAQRRAAFKAGDGKRAADRLRDHVETQILCVRSIGREPLDLREYQPRVDLLHHIPAEAQTLDAARRHVLDS